MQVDAVTPRFPAVLRRARTAAGLTYRALAARCGLSHSYLSQLEKGERRTPRMDRVVAIAAALDALTPPFLIAALADRVGDDVARLAAALLTSARVAVSQQLDVGIVQVERPAGGGAARARALRRLAAGQDAPRALARRLYFVDLQFDPEILRVAFNHDGGEPTVLALIGDGAASQKDPHPIPHPARAGRGGAIRPVARAPGRSPGTPPAKIPG